MAHKDQGNGSYKGAKKDKHETPAKCDKEKKKKGNDDWVDRGKNTNSARNKNRKSS